MAHSKRVSALLTPPKAPKQPPNRSRSIPKPPKFPLLSSPMGVCSSRARAGQGRTGAAGSGMLGSQRERTRKGQRERGDKSHRWFGMELPLAAPERRILEMGCAPARGGNAQGRGGAAVSPQVQLQSSARCGRTGDDPRFIREGQNCENGGGERAFWSHGMAWVGILKDRKSVV